MESEGKAAAFASIREGQLALPLEHIRVERPPGPHDEGNGSSGPGGEWVHPKKTREKKLEIFFLEIWVA